MSNKTSKRTRTPAVFRKNDKAIESINVTQEDDNFVAYVALSGTAPDVVLFESPDRTETVLYAERLAMRFNKTLNVHT